MKYSSQSKPGILENGLKKLGFVYNPGPPEAKFFYMFYQDSVYNIHAEVYHSGMLYWYEIRDLNVEEFLFEMEYLGAYRTIHYCIKTVDFEIK